LTFGEHLRPVLVIVGTPHWRWARDKRPYPPLTTAPSRQDESAWHALGLRPGLVNSLLRYRLSIADVATMSDRDLLRLRNVARKGVAEIRAKCPHRGATK
jgi:hypothetical protein